MSPSQLYLSVCLDSQIGASTLKMRQEEMPTDSPDSALLSREPKVFVLL